jgi:glycosyltransferase involved in cell wall biosynthesis
VKISILLPAFNEANNIAKTIEGLMKFKADFGEKYDLDIDILVIDDGSTDETFNKAKQCNVNAIKLAQNQGKGGALREGIKSADGDIVVFLDADLKESSYEVYKLILPILRNESDVVIAKFKPVKKKGGFGFVKTLAFKGVKFFTGQEITSSLSGQRAFKKHVLDDIGYIPDGYSLEVGMLIDILNKGYRVKEVEVDMSHDVTGRDFKGFMHRGKQFMDILKVLMSKLRERNTVA